MASFGDVSHRMRRATPSNAGACEQDDQPRRGFRAGLGQSWYATRRVSSALVAWLVFPALPDRTRTVTTVLTGVELAGCGEDGSTAARQEEVRLAGAEVMPFDPGKTKHSFVKTDDGGVQTVVSLDVDDAGQIRLVREHLFEIRDEFSAGRVLVSLSLSPRRG